MQHTPGLWGHRTRPILFTLVVDDFGIQYVDKEHAMYLVDALQRKYKVTSDWSGSSYCGMKLEWNYTDHYVDVSMPNYVHRALTQFQHDIPNKCTNSPSAWTPPMYGQKIQFATSEDLSEPMSTSQLLRLHQVVGNFLYYARAVDSTMLVAIGDLASAQNCGTKNTATQLVHFLNYVVTHPDAVL